MGLFDAVGDLFGVGSDPGKNYNNQGLSLFSSIQAPTEEDLKYQLQQLVYQGDLTPEDAQTIYQQKSEMGDVSGSAQAKGAQLQALAQLQGLSNGGLNEQDLAALSDVQSRNAQAERGSREAILQNARERGVAGSGTELLAQLINQQGSAERGNQAGLDIAAQSRQRALDAILQSAQLGGNIENQTFSENAQKAQAQDAINRFNAQTAQDIVNRNVAARNAAQERNLNEKQRVSDTNTQIKNQEIENNANAKQKVFEDQLAKAAGTSGQLQNLAAGERDNLNRKAALTGSFLNTLGLVGGGYLARK